MRALSNPRVQLSSVNAAGDVSKTIYYVYLHAPLHFALAGLLQILVDLFIFYQLASSKRTPLSAVAHPHPSSQSQSLHSPPSSPLSSAHASLRTSASSGELQFGVLTERQSSV